MDLQINANQTKKGMSMRLLLGIVIASGMVVSASVSDATPIYLNKDNITVSVGAGTSDGSFNNTFNNGNTIEKVIDAPSADAEEFHNQNTHIYFTADDVGGGLELVFDFGQEYDISTLHFWNYTNEFFDVDNVDFTFFNGGGTQVGTLAIEPALGSTPGIAAEDIILPAPLNVQTVNAFLTGSNRQVDFQNIGFTAVVSSPQPPRNDIPAPASIFLLAGGLIGVGAFAGRRRQ